MYTALLPSTSVARRVRIIVSMVSRVSVPASSALASPDSGNLRASAMSRDALNPGGSRPERSALSTGRASSTGDGPWNGARGAGAMSPAAGGASAMSERSMRRSPSTGGGTWNGAPGAGAVLLAVGGGSSLPRPGPPAGSGNARSSRGTMGCGGSERCNSSMGGIVVDGTAAGGAPVAGGSCMAWVARASSAPYVIVRFSHSLAAWTSSLPSTVVWR